MELENQTENILRRRDKNRIVCLIQFMSKVKLGFIS